MAILLNVKWVEKTDEVELHRRIRHIGGDSKHVQWKHTQEQAIEAIEGGQFAYYMKKDGHTLRLNVGQTTDGRKYLIIESGGNQPQLPLDMPEFPTRHSS
jgi:hypothetical protein